MAHKKRILSACLSAASLLATTMALTAPAGAVSPACTVSPTDLQVDSEEQQLLTLLNNHRAAHGRQPVTLHTDVTRAAAWMSRDMVDRNFMPADHVDSNGRNIPSRLTWCGVRWTAWAENIYAGSPEAEDAFEWWKNSPPHNTNMLSSAVTVVGIARAFGAGTTFGWYWTLDFATVTPTPATVIAGGTWYLDGTTAKSGAVGTTLNVYATGAFENISYQLVLALGNCSNTVAVLNATLRFANASGFIPRTVGTVPAGVAAGSYNVCFRSTPDLSQPAATAPAAFTLR